MSWKRISQVLFLAFSCGFTSPGFAEEMTFLDVSNGGNCYDGCNWVAAQGEITAATPDAFKTFMTTSHPDTQTTPIKVIYLHSQGGNLGAALRLGRLFRELGVTVRVAKSVKQEGDWGDQPNPFYSDEPGACLSACAYAFLGGKLRDLADDASLGFHQFYNSDILSNIDAQAFTGADRLKDQARIGILIEYLIEMGIDTALYPFIAVAGPNEMKTVSVAEAVRLKIDNNRDPAGDWNLLAYEKGLVAEITTQRTGRKLRIYCSSKKQAHVAFFVPNGSGFPAFKEVFDVKGDPLVIYGNGGTFKASFNTEAFNKETKESILVLNVSIKDAKSLASGDRISASNEAKQARVLETLYAELSLAGIAGDKRLPEIALRNCIKG